MHNPKKGECYRVDKNFAQKFLKAQEKTYPVALKEIKNGRKESHWMWYIFPQLRALGMSPTAMKYGIEDLEEAKAYLEHPILSARLVEISEALVDLGKYYPEEIFDDIDAMKLCSCMTLFAQVSEWDSVFYQVLEQYFDGVKDEKTLELLGVNR